jgi:hypothetical protein
MYFYISFAADDGFRGATVVKGRSAEDALKEATRRGLNPGGEAAILAFPPGAAERESDLRSASARPWRSMINRLVGKEELIAAGAKRVGDLPGQLKSRWEREAEIVCNDCNR